MPTREQIATFDDQQPEGMTPWVGNARPGRNLVIADPDPTWPQRYDDVAARVRDALGMRALSIEHVGSTSVPGLPAKPIIDIDLVVADPDDEARYVPALEDRGFVLHVREPWWYRHRMLRLASPLTNLHVWGPDSPEMWRHRILRDWLRGDAEDRDRYARAKREAAAAANAAGEHVMAYNARKQDELRQIIGRALAAAGIVD